MLVCRSTWWAHQACGHHDGSGQRRAESDLHHLEDLESYLLEPLTERLDVGLYLRRWWVGCMDCYSLDQVREIVYKLGRYCLSARWNSTPNLEWESPRVPWFYRRVFWDGIFHNASWRIHTLHRDLWRCSEGSERYITLYSSLIQDGSGCFYQHCSFLWILRLITVATLCYQTSI